LLRAASFPTPTGSGWATICRPSGTSNSRNSEILNLKSKG
jgi:hypothetical protein